MDLVIQGLEMAVHCSSKRGVEWGRIYTNQEGAFTKSKCCTDRA